MNHIQRKHHDLKTDMWTFIESMQGRKPWEVRKNDRGFRVGDTVTLHETQYPSHAMAEGAPLKYTGRTIHGCITWVMHGAEYGLADGWCIFSFQQSESGELVEPQVMGRVSHMDDGSVICHLNSVGRELPDHTPLFTIQGSLVPDSLVLITRGWLSTHERESEALQRWHDQCVERGFDGVANALETLFAVQLGPHSIPQPAALTPCAWCENEYTDELMQHETEAGDAICDYCWRRSGNPPSAGTDDRETGQ